YVFAIEAAIALHPTSAVIPERPRIFAPRDSANAMARTVDSFQPRSLALSKRAITSSGIPAGSITNSSLPFSFELSSRFRSTWFIIPDRHQSRLERIQPIGFPEKAAA